MHSERAGIADQVTVQFVQWAHFLRLVAGTRLGMRSFIVTGNYWAASVTRSLLALCVWGKMLGIPPDD
jgi:hypothetical protein